MKELYQRFLESSGVCTDTRKIEKNCLFVSLKGSNFNGNVFAAQAIEQGAKYAIVDESEYATNDNIILVENCLLFLQKLASHHRKQFNIPIVGITGSNGKTSTKELIYSVLKEKYNVLATQGNLNNHIGVPLTILRLNSAHELAIIEMGANHFGDIKELCEIAEPTHGIITNIGKAHLEGFKDFDGVLKTKKELYDSVSLRNGTIVYNNDDDILRSILPSNTTNIDYGENGKYVSGTLDRLTPFVRMQWSTDSYVSPTLEMQMIGKYNFYNYLAATAFGRLFNLSNEQICNGLVTYAPTNNRSQVTKTINNTLIMDCYNANPSSMKSALESFANIEHPDKHFIIGDMLELGDESEKEHQLIATLCEKLEITGWTVGPRFCTIKSEQFIKQFNDTAEVILELNINPISNNLILLKGSRGIGLEVLKENL